jgi:hypothetical protein
MPERSFECNTRAVADNRNVPFSPLCLTSISRLETAPGYKGYLLDLGIGLRRVGRIPTFREGRSERWPRVFAEAGPGTWAMRWPPEPGSSVDCLDGLLGSCSCVNGYHARRCVGQREMSAIMNPREHGLLVSVSRVLARAVILRDFLFESLTFRHLDRDPAHTLISMVRSLCALAFVLIPTWSWSQMQSRYRRWIAWFICTAW